LLLSQFTGDMVCGCNYDFTTPSSSGGCVLLRQTIINYFDIQVR